MSPFHHSVANACASGGASAAQEKAMTARSEAEIQAENLRQLAFERMLSRGLQDVRQGRLITNAEMDERIRAWQK